MSSTLTLQQIHSRSFESYRIGNISFGECWDQQRDLLEKCEEILKQEISQLQSLLSQNKLNPDATQSTTEDYELELDEDFHEENVKIEETGKNQTWSIGILSNFIRKNDNNQKTNTGERGKMPEKPLKELQSSSLLSCTNPL